MDNNHKRKGRGKMKRYLKLLPILILTLLIIETVPVKSHESLEKFCFLEEKIGCYGTFIENGVRLEYSTKKSIEDEIIKLKFNIEKQFNKEVNIDKNTITFKENSKEIKAIVWSNEEETKVQISYVNNNSKITTNQMKKELEQLEDFATKNIKYFNFVKVKIIEERKQNILDLLRNNLKKETLEELNIYNGKVYKGLLTDGSKVNFSFMKYKDEEYLVLGTPVIFITY